MWMWRERKSFGILITYKRLMQHEVMKPKKNDVDVESDRP
jgi:hypothetical protein